MSGARETSTPQAVVILVAGANGGCGASLLAGALALASARAEGGAWLVELDLDRGDRGEAWGMPGERTLGDLLLVAGEMEARHLRQAAHTGPYGLRVVNAPPDPGAAGAWSPEAIRRLVRSARAAAGAGGCAVVDAGTGLSAAARAAAAEADVTLIVCSPTVGAARRARRLVAALPHSSSERCGLVLVRGPAPREIGAAALARAASAHVRAELPWSPGEAARLVAGRWPSGRRRGLASAVQALSDGFR